MTFNNKGKGWGNKIKNFAKDIVVDVDPFGIERLIHEHSRAFALKESRNNKSEPDLLNLKIKKTSSGEIQCAVCDNTKVIREITLSEMVKFFTGDHTNLSNPETKVTEGTSNYIQDYADKWKFELEDLTFRIFTTDKTAYINFYFRDGKIGQAKTKSIIKYFNK